MENIYIDKTNTTLKAEKERLIIIPENQRARSIPLNCIERITIACNTQLNSSLFSKLCGHGVELTIINRQKYEHSSNLTPSHQNNPFLKMAHYRLISNNQWQQIACNVLIQQKLKQQTKTLNTLFKNHPNAHKSRLHKFNQLVQTQQNTLTEQQHSLTIKTLLGIEGCCAHAYFSAIADIIPSSWEFKARVKRPPTDPFNALLSLTYTMLHKEACKALFSSSFDPMIGMFHQPCYGRQSFACDLVELFRAKADMWIINQIKQQTFRHQHFSEPNKNGCYLNKSGRIKYFQEYEHQAKIWRKQMRRWCKFYTARLTTLMTTLNSIN